MASINKKAWFVALLVVVTAITIFVAKDKLFTPKELVASGSATEHSSLVSTELAHASSEVLGSSQNQKAQEAGTSSSISGNLEFRGITTAGMEVLKKWQLDRGYAFLLHSNDEYKTYSKDTLQKLASSGDIRALQMIAEQSGVTEEAKKLYSKAVLLGSTWALSSLSTLSATNSLMSDDPAAKKAYVIESMAYVKVAVMRGDTEIYLTDLTSSLTTNPSQLPLSESDYAEVKPLAEKTYKELEQQRKALGLGAFDNSVPPEVVQYSKLFDPRLSGVKPRY